MVIFLWFPYNVFVDVFEQTKTSESTIVESYLTAGCFQRDKRS